MMNKLVNKLARLSLLPIFLFAASPAVADQDVSDFLKEGTFSGEMRYRYEHVDQDGFNKNANAGTLRTNLGFQTGMYKNFQAGIEGQMVKRLGMDSFNDTVNGKGAYPTVADPNTIELNQAWLSWSGIPNTEIKVGRQAVNLDNQRFVSSVDWRQNDQTLDAGFVTVKPMSDTTVQYGYIFNVNRINGNDHPQGDLESKSHIFRVEKRWSELFNTTAYGYLFDFANSPGNSSKTYGIRVTGKKPLDAGWTLAYEAEVARQSNFGNNPSRYDETYYHIAPSVTGHGFTIQAGYEVLGGNGVQSFQTPLASLHKFNGWADKFLITPARGLRDAYVSASYRYTNEKSAMNNTALAFSYHDFAGDTSGNFGREYDVSLAKTFILPQGQPLKKMDVMIKFADYKGEELPYRDTQKIWLQAGASF